MTAVVAAQNRLATWSAPSDHATAPGDAGEVADEPAIIARGVYPPVGRRPRRARRRTRRRHAAMVRSGDRLLFAWVEKGSSPWGRSAGRSCLDEAGCNFSRSRILFSEVETMIPTIEPESRSSPRIRTRARLSLFHFGPIDLEVRTGTARPVGRQRRRQIDAVALDPRPGARRQLGRSARPADAGPRRHVT